MEYLKGSSLQHQGYIILSLQEKVLRLSDNSKTINKKGIPAKQGFGKNTRAKNQKRNAKKFF